MNTSHAEQQLTRIKYPHMKQYEIEIWKRFLRQHGKGFTDFKYDVHVGKGIGIVPGYDKVTQDMAIHLSQKRIDVVAYRGARAFIVEIKDRAGMSAIGQLVAYKRLYEEKYGPGTIAGLAIVARDIDPDIEHVAKTMNIEVVLV